MTTEFSLVQASRLRGHAFRKKEVPKKPRIDALSIREGHERDCSKVDFDAVYENAFPSGARSRGSAALSRR